MTRTFKRAWGKVRRFGVVRLRRSYVQVKLQRRQGECRRCGNCCKIVFHCPWLHDGAHCDIYEKRPVQCRAFPIDERDLREVPECGFYFGAAARKDQAVPVSAHDPAGF